MIFGTTLVYMYCCCCSCFFPGLNKISGVYLFFLRFCCCFFVNAKSKTLLFTFWYRIMDEKNKKEEQNEKKRMNVSSNKNEFLNFFIVNGCFSMVIIIVTMETYLIYSRKCTTIMFISIKNTNSYWSKHVNGKIKFRVLSRYCNADWL